MSETIDCAVTVNLQPTSGWGGDPARCHQRALLHRAHTLETISEEKTSSLVSGHTPPLANVDATTDMILHVACGSHRASALITTCMRHCSCAYSAYNCAPCCPSLSGICGPDPCFANDLCRTDCQVAANHRWRTKLPACYIWAVQHTAAALTMQRKGSPRWSNRRSKSRRLSRGPPQGAALGGP